MFFLNDVFFFLNVMFIFICVVVILSRFYVGGCCYLFLNKNLFRVGICLKLCGWISIDFFYFLSKFIRSFF